MRKLGSKRVVLLAALGAFVTAGIVFAVQRSRSETEVHTATTALPLSTTTTSSSLVSSAAAVTETTNTPPPSITSSPGTLPHSTPEPTTTSEPDPTPQPGANATWSITPSSGPGGTTTDTHGDGCTNGSGGQTSWVLTEYDTSGVRIQEDGGPVEPDGTWQVPEVYGQAGSPAGEHRIAAKCVGDSKLLFNYPDLTFTVT